jgi:hypothetical protein
MFFGEPERSEPFRFDNVWNSFQAVGGTAADEPGNSETDLGDDGASDEPVNRE